MRKVHDFMKSSKLLNSMKLKCSYGIKDFESLMRRSDLPTSWGFKQQLLARGVIYPVGRGLVMFQEKPVHFLDLDKAFEKYRAEFRKKKEEPSVSEDEIKNALALLRSQGDRFIIYEKL